MQPIFIVLSFRCVSRLSKSMTKSKRSIKPLQISRRIQYTLEGHGVHMKRNLPGTQMCGRHPLQLRETTGIYFTTVKIRHAMQSWLFNFTYSILSHVLGYQNLGYLKNKNVHWGYKTAAKWDWWQSLILTLLNLDQLQNNIIVTYFLCTVCKWLP